MQYGRIAGIDKPLSRLILGGGPLNPDRQEKGDAMLDAFFAAGGTGVDTAHIYGRDGASERALGRWMAARGNRERVFLITKGAHHASDFTPRVTPEVITAELLESLERMQTDHVDLYLMHRDNTAVPVGPLVECLNEHLAAGRIRAFGGSNWSPRRIEEANAYAAAHGLKGLAASSPFFALAVAHDAPEMRHAIINGDREAMAWYRETQFPLLSWTSQAQGFFSDRARRDDPEALRRFRRYDHEDNWERRRRVRELADKRGVTGTQVALAWVLQQGMNVHPIVGTGTVPHLEEALGALSLALSAEESAWLNLER